MFKFPCSYLIYSSAFNELPKPLKEKIYARLYEVLSGQDKSPEYQKLARETRRAVLEILADTKPDLPPEWRNAAHAKI
jgi:hypothetical protein